MNSIDKFIAYQLSYKNRKRHNVNAKLDYLINQVNTLFDIIKEEIIDKPVTTISASPLNTEITEPIVKLYNNLTEDNPDTDISLRVKDKLSLFGLDSDYVGCKIIIDLCNIAPVNGITEDTDYDTICNTLCPKDPNYIKRNITFIRKKIKGQKFETNMDLLKYFIELCY